MREDLLSVALNHITVELLTSELDCCLLQGLLFSRQVKIHGMFDRVTTINFELKGGRQVTASRHTLELLVIDLVR